MFYWLSRPAALDINGKALRIARPPTWTPHVVARARRGHLLSGSTVLTATRAGIDLIGRAFGPRARARDC